MPWACFRMWMSVQGSGAVRDLLDGFPSDLGHDGTLSSQVLIAQTEEVVDHECWRKTGRRSVTSVQTVFTFHNGQCGFTWIYSIFQLFVLTSPFNQAQMIETNYCDSVFGSCPSELWQRDRKHRTKFLKPRQLNETIIFQLFTSEQFRLTQIHS